MICMLRKHKPDTRTPFQKGEIVLSNLQKAGAEGHPVKWETPTAVDTQPEQIPVTYCDHIEEVTAAAAPDHEITDEGLVKLCRYIRPVSYTHLTLPTNREV